MWSSIKRLSITPLLLSLFLIECCFATVENSIEDCNRRLMLPGEERTEDIYLLQEYGETIGQQQQRLSTDSGFTRGSLRFISSLDKLSVGYGLLPRESGSIPKLKLPHQNYDELREIGVAVKVLLGYLKLSANDFLTPDDINVLVPHLSCVVQNTPEGKPELKSLGCLREKADDPVTVILSGNQAAHYKGPITEFFNHIYRRESTPEIQVIDVEEVADVYLPHVIQDWVCRKRVEPFEDSYLGTVIQKKIIDNYPPIKLNQKEIQQDPKSNKNLSQNKIYCTTKVLKYLLDKDFKKILRKRYDTISHLVKEFGEETSTEIPPKENEKAFYNLCRDKKDLLLKAAIKRTRGFSEIFEEDNKEELHKVLDYINICLFPEENLATFEQCQNFWLNIKNINLTCSNPHSRYGSLCSISKRLQKYLSQWADSHTEQFLVKYLRGKPEILTHALETHTAPESTGGFKPLFLGYIIDSFSWLDVCEACTHFLNINQIWKETLDLIVPRIEEKGYSVPIKPLDSLFRCVSQHEYGNVPLDLTYAEGGHDYLKEGWDFRFLSRERIVLNTRFGWKNLKTRDQVIERVQSRLMNKVLSKSFVYWKDNQAIWNLIVDQSESKEFFLNALKILQLKNPDQKVFRLGLAYRDQTTRLELLKHIVEEETEWTEEEKDVLKAFNTPLSQEPQKYSKALYGEALLMEAEEEENYLHMKDKIGDFAQYCLVYFQEDNHEKLNFNDSLDKILKYWKEFWKCGTRSDQWRTPEEKDKPNIAKVIDFLWQLYYNDKYNESLPLEDKEKFLTKFKDLKKPTWVSRLEDKAKNDAAKDNLKEAA